MPYTPTTPTSEDVSTSQVTSKDLDTFHIHQIMIKKDPNGAPIEAEIIWSEGYTDTGVYKVVKTHKDTFTGAVVEAKTSAYSELKAAAWELLDEAGKLPDGEIG